MGGARELVFDVLIGGRLFIELTSEGLADLRRDLAERSVPTKETWWGYETLQVDDPDGNELFFPRPD